MRNTKMIWIYKPTGFMCRTRKEMKDYLGKVSYFNVALKNGDLRYINDYIAYNELQKSQQQHC